MTMMLEKKPDTFFQLCVYLFYATIETIFIRCLLNGANKIALPKSTIYFLRSVYTHCSPIFNMDIKHSHGLTLVVV